MFVTGFGIFSISVALGDNFSFFIRSCCEGKEAVRGLQSQHKVDTT
jgi:hypothetical protein